MLMPEDPYLVVGVVHIPLAYIVRDEDGYTHLRFRGQFHIDECFRQVPQTLEVLTTVDHALMEGFPIKPTIGDEVKLSRCRSSGKRGLRKIARAISDCLPMSVCATILEKPIHSRDLFFPQ